MKRLNGSDGPALSYWLPRTAAAAVIGAIYAYPVPADASCPLRVPTSSDICPD
jgi:hypothetical protein